MIKVHSAPFNYGQPIEYFKSSTQQQFALNQLVKIGSSGAGGLEHCAATTRLPDNAFITLKATTGSSVEMVPVLRVLPNVQYIVDHCSSETVRSTTDVGLTCAISSSGGAVVASTGAFRINVITNTSDTSAQMVIGNFVFTSTAV